MSWEHTSWVLNCSPTVGTERLLLVGLSNHLDEDGESWPGIATLARYANVSESAARRGLQRLETNGHVKIERNAGGTRAVAGNRRPNRYTVYDNDGSPLTIARARAGVARTRPQEPGVANDGAGVAFDDLGVAFDADRGSAQTRPNRALEPAVLNQHLENNESPALPGVSVPAAFDAFYESYPKKKAKEDAHAAYRTVIRSGVTPAAVLAGLDRWCGYWTAAGTDGTFIPYPASWLRKRGWEDDPGPAPSRNGKLHRLPLQTAAGDAAARATMQTRRVTQEEL